MAFIHILSGICALVWVLSCLITKMSRCFHARMQNTHYQHAIIQRDVKDDVGLMLQTPKVWRKVVGGVAQHWVVSKIL